MTRRAALAVSLALLAAVVLAVGSFAVFRADAGLEADEPAALAGAGRALLGTGDDRTLRQALAAFEAARADGLPPAEALERHAAAEAALGRVVREDGDFAHVALAGNLSGVLLVEDAELDPSSAPRFLQLALESFRQAVLSDPGNEDAKANLELLVALLTEGRGGVGFESGSQGTTGAGTSDEGSGY